MLDGLIDESDPDVDFPNSFHAFQTAEGIRKAHPDKGATPACSSRLRWGCSLQGPTGVPFPSRPRPPASTGTSCALAAAPPLAHPVPLPPRLVPPRGAPARPGEGPGSGRGAPGEGREWRVGRVGLGQPRLWAQSTHLVGKAVTSTHGCLSIPSGQWLETPSQLAAVPRPLWFSVTPLSRTTLTSKILDTGAPPALLVLPLHRVFLSPLTLHFSLQHRARHVPAPLRAGERPHVLGP